MHPSAPAGLTPAVSLRESAAAGAPPRTTALGEPDDATQSIALAKPGDAGPCLAALATGLGLPAGIAEQPEEWERLGATLRLLLDGLRLMLSDRKALRSELRVPDPTQFYYSDNNPLKSDLALEDLVGILMRSSGDSATYLPFDRAVQEAVDDLRSHNLAIIAAARAAVAGVMVEFDPQRLRTNLQPGGKAGAVAEGAPSFLERGRLWKAYADHYETMNANMADWIERVFDRHFVGAYSREAARLRSR